ncbi:MarR family winged helix-turn-helix transcriptional regulator [Vibrio viridaestus]|uniref:MarR family transcriptional regulator n=1 Tax=Vibrio viridaestus TaxID=2487322 RepID=A0A3N9TFQ2_9VIBR|nr:MarR family transcriptional regulator [Vibrio viridaestus]RQW62724.1 MarR family transcriptional regulator [Vibrio viridaestus]
MAKPTLGYLMWDIIREIRKLFQEDPRLSCLTLSQAKVLSCIYHNEGIKQVELADYLDLSPMTVVRLIDFLVAEELISRQPDPSDRRAHLLYIEPKAESIMEKVKLVSDDIWAKALEGLSAQQITGLTASLEQIKKNLRDKEK